MLSESELIADKSIAKDASHNIVYLYVKVRCFSFAKCVIAETQDQFETTESKGTVQGNMQG